MNRINPRVLGVLIVLGGLCAALPFQKLGSHSTPADRADHSAAIQWRSNDFTLELSGNTDPLTGTPDADEHPRSPAFGGARPAAIHARASLDNVAQPPALAGEYASAATDGSATAPQDSGASGGFRRDKPADSEPPTTTPLSSLAITHTIADGDTLKALAEKHLGSSLRWTEIYNANPELLDDPEVLPLGVTIVILPGIHSAPSATTAADDGLVPVSRNDLQRFRDANE